MNHDTAAAIVAALVLLAALAQAASHYTNQPRTYAPGTVATGGGL